MEHLGPAETRQLEAVVRLVREMLDDVALGAYLLGSAVRGGIRRDSDLDVFVVAARRVWDAMVSAIERTDASARDPAHP